MKPHAILVIVLGLFLFASFGCVTENTYAPTQKENVVSADFTDLDGDGTWDYAVYEFSEIRADNKLKIKRRLAVSATTSSEYATFNNLTDLELLETDGYLEDFHGSKKIAEDSCAGSIGLMSLTCVDVNTCVNLCGAGSVTCRKITADYRETLGGSMIYFVKDNSRIDSNLYEARNIVLDLRTATWVEKDLYLEKIRDIISAVASLNTNPLVFQPELSLCQHSDYGIESLVKAAEKIGEYDTEVTGYTYTMTIDAEPMLQEGLANEMTGIEIKDTVPGDALTSTAFLSSYHAITTDAKGDDIEISWTSSEMSDVSYILSYRFSSDTPPEEFVTELTAPTVTLKTLDLSALGPTNALFLFLLDTTGNYYISIGAAIGITISLLLLLYSLIILVISLAGAKMADRKLAYGIKKAFGKTRIEWKIDGVVAVLLLIAGSYISIAFTPEPFSVITLITSFDYLLSEPMAFIGTALVLLGVILAYKTLENLAKITLLERIYGVAVREERSRYISDIAALRKKMEVLKRMVKEYATQDFEVSEEYDILSSISAERLREFEKKMTSYTRASLDEYLEKVDAAIERLEDKKKMADENWLQWKESIAKILSEQNEVYASSLVSVPSSLRDWVLAKYVKESGEDGLMLEGSIIKRRTISPLILIKEMVSDGLLKGGVILKKGEVLAAWFEKGKSPTVATALLFKLRSYLHSLNKVIDLGGLTSFVSVGNDTVFVVMKSATYDSAIFINKEKFREAVETWKKKMKMLSEE